MIAGLVTTAVIAAFWDDISDFVENSFRAAKKAVNEQIYASKVFIQRLGKKVKIIARHYFMRRGEVYAFERSEYVPEVKVPPDILARANGRNELELSSCAY